MIPGNLLNDKICQKKLYNCPEDNLGLAMSPFISLCDVNYLSRFLRSNILVIFTHIDLGFF